MSELVFEVTQEANGGYCAEGLTAEILTQGDARDALTGNIHESARAYHFDRTIPDRIRLHLVPADTLALR